VTQNKYSISETFERRGGYEMALDIWFKEDIRNILLGVELASAHLATHYSDDEVRAYREGFKAALAAAAVSFGIYPGEVEVEVVRRQSRATLLPLSRGR
jgi:hypothetical protein